MNGLGYSKNSVYQQNVGFLKQYTPTAYRLIHLRCVRSAGFEERGNPTKGKKGSAGNSSKMAQSLSRSKSRIHELALCNPWEYFITLTISPEKFDRNNLPAYQKQLSKWLNNYNTRKGYQVRYLLIPEPHKNGAWHMHGLLMGLPLQALTLFTMADNIPSNIKRMLSQKRMIYNWGAYASTFGWVTVEQIIDHDRCASYMTKYITKQLQDSSVALNHHVYYASKGLARATLIHRGDMKENFEPDFENDYVRIKHFTNAEDALPYFCDKEDTSHGTPFIDGEGNR